MRYDDYSEEVARRVSSEWKVKVDYFVFVVFFPFALSRSCRVLFLYSSIFKVPIFKILLRDGPRFAQEELCQ